MDRKKPVPVPPLPRNIKHGCVSCKHKDVPVKAEPCRSCENWSAWEDKDT